MSGRLGALNLAAITNTLLYSCPASKVSTVNVSICNRNSTEVAIRLAIVDGGVIDLANEDYIEYDTHICSNGVLERTGIVLSELQSLVVYSDTASVSAVCWGFEETA